MCHSKGAYDPDPSQLQHMISILSDRWFSSFWTLQEAYLQGEDAILMSRDGSLIEYQSGTKTYPSRYLDSGWLCGIGTHWFYESARILSDDIVTNAETYHTFIDILMKRGLYHIQLRNELAMYNAVRNRVTSYPEDRIYGIQQVFGLRVGKSAVSTNTGKYFTSTEVEDQFGEQILQHFPVLSQYHSFMQQVPPAKRWRFRDEALMVAGSPMAEVQGTRKQGSANRPCSFWVDHTQPDRKPVYWNGPLASLCVLKRGMDHLLMEEVFLLRLALDPSALQIANEGGMLRVVLDHIDEISDLNEVENATMIETYERLERRFPNEELKVLVLGQSLSNNQGAMFGILLNKGSDNDWAKLGTYHWSVPLWAGREDEKLLFL